MTKQNAGVLVSIYTHEDDKERLQMELLAGNFKYLLTSSGELDDNDYDSFIECLTDVMNQAYVIKNTANIVVSVAENVVEFIEGREEDIKKEVDQLLLEM